MELKNIILFILLIITIIAMSFSNLTGSDAHSTVDPDQVPLETDEHSDVVLTGAQ